MARFLLMMLVLAGGAPEPGKGWLLTVVRWIDANFIDPDSIGTIQVSPMTPYNDAWASCAYINAKNRMGGYTGRRGHVFVFSGDRLVEVIDGNLGDMECSQFKVFVDFELP